METKTRDTDRSIDDRPRPFRCGRCNDPLTSREIRHLERGRPYCGGCAGEVR